MLGAMPKHAVEEGLEAFCIIKGELWVTCQLGSDVLVEFNDDPVIEQIDIIELPEDEFPVPNEFCGSVGICEGDRITVVLEGGKPSTLRFD